ncbi:MAG TPA: molybdopterin cofactor-binding domain-containing protein [Pseudonocardia sp.]|nr:molybdopterin cofactor-binding domain-containing protein [Pseudonocardia sp.]
MTAPSEAFAATLAGAIPTGRPLADWVRVHRDGVVEIRSGKVELGQGILTAFAQIAAEELDVGLARIRMTAAGTDISPDEGLTAGSLSVQTAGPTLRSVCAQVRAVLVAAAADRLGVAADDLVVDDGWVSTPTGGSVSYWQLPADELLDRPVTGTATPKPTSAYRVVGASVPRIDLPDKLLGRPRYVHDLAPAGLLFGRIVRPSSPGSTLVAADPAGALAIPGVVTVVHDGDFLGVVAEREEVAVRAADQLRSDTTWRAGATLPDEAELSAFLTAAPAETTVLAEHGELGAAATVLATYHRPYLAHGSIGLCSATALTTTGASPHLEVWTHSQGIYPLRRELARALTLPADAITVRHVEGAGCYGHNGADDVAMDAALLALAVPERPVQVVWSRADELAWAPFGPAATVRLAARVGPDGEVRAWHHEVWGNGHISRPGSLGSVALLAAGHLADGARIDPAMEPPLASGGGAGRNAVPGYAFPAYRSVNHRLLTMPLRTSAMRALGAFVNVFATESFLDELAVAAGRDPVEYRLAHLTDPRARAVLETAAARAGWGTDRRAESTGRGIGFARYKNSGAYCAVVAEVEAIEQVRVRRLTVVVDAGLVVNPDGAENQIEGGAVQATSWTLKERVRFDRCGVTSDSWQTYPILRFSEVPSVAVAFLDAAGNPSLGVGEAAQGPTAAAIGNAVFDALGVRVRSLPFTEEQIIAAMPD